VLLTSGCATGITAAPNSIGPTGASFSGKVISDTGGQVEYWAQYGPTQAYGSETQHQTIGVAKDTLVAVDVTISGLQRSTVYHYRLCAQDSQQQGGPGCGSDQRFTTQSVGCGETVTSNVKLTGDLECPQQAGLVVGAAEIDINLARHRLLGDIAVGGGGPTGIDNTGGFDDVTIRNGTVDLFGTGIETQGASRNHILQIKSSAANTAVVIRGGDANEVRHGDLFGRSIGLAATGSSSLVVADTSSVGTFGDGLTVTGDHARIVRDSMSRPGGLLSSISAIRLVGSGGRIADNVVSGVWPTGGIHATGADNVLVGNQVADNDAPTVPNPPPDWGDGIFVGAFSSGVVLRGNSADRNAGDGIDVRATGTKLDSNHAFDNGGWGILAVPGVIDLGGNTAGGNGAGQCRNVFCP
jgi:hypothetical protein